MTLRGEVEQAIAAGRPYILITVVGTQIEILFGGDPEYPRRGLTLRSSWPTLRNAQPATWRSNPMTGPDPRRQTLIPGQRTVGDAVAARRSRLVQAEQYIAGRWTRVTRVMSLPSEERQELVAIARWIEDGGPRPWEDTPATGEQPYPPIGPGEKVDPL